MKSFVVLIAALVLCTLAQQTPGQRAAALVAQMSTSQKFSMIAGISAGYAGSTPAIPSLGIPQLNLQDGPQGVGDGAKNVTNWPCANMIVATWDQNAMYDFAQAMAVEQRIKGTNVMLGPMVNIARIPLGGRNFESFGEDPTLAATMVRSSVTGIQSVGIMATVKHFVDNNQESNRTTVSENVPQRAQWEIYYPAFAAAVDAGVASVMCSYNRINDTWACSNPQTLSDLKDRMGFAGYVMSDWGATVHPGFVSTVTAANAGLDMEMPSPYIFSTANLTNATNSGAVNMSRIDDMVTRILTSAYAVGIMDTPQTGNLSAIATSEQHSALAVDLAIRSTVLLQNVNNILPLNINQLAGGTLAIIGDNAKGANIEVDGCGSGEVVEYNVSQPYDSIVSMLGGTARVLYAATSPASSAAYAAAVSDVAIVWVVASSCEGSDRANLSLSAEQDLLITTVASTGTPVVVVLNTVGAVLMPWINDVAAVIWTGMPGQGGGDAIAQVLFGAEPGGRLPITFPASETQWCCDTQQQWPGINLEADYSEELLVGYRYFDANKLEPLFPFGYGLSYSEFNIGELNVLSLDGGLVNVSVVVSNLGPYNGSTVVQLYLAYPESAGEPPVVLRHFQKVWLAVGESLPVTFTLNPIADAVIWDVTVNDWVLVSGDDWFVYVGQHSRDLGLSQQFSFGSQ